MKLRVMTFNIQHAKNFVSKHIDYKAVADLINKYNVDIVGLNEVYGNQLSKINKFLNYNCYFGKSTRIWGREYGNAVLSKYKINDCKVIKIPNPLFRIGFKAYQTRSLLSAKINGIDIFITHLGLNESEKAKGIRAIIDNIWENKCILMGDFNGTSENELIKLLEDYLKKSNDILTYPSNKPNIRLDYIYVSRDIKITNSFVPEDVVSDHRPYIVDIEIK